MTVPLVTHNEHLVSADNELMMNLFQAHKLLFCFETKAKCIEILSVFPVEAA